MAMTKEQLLIPRVLCIGGKEGDPNYPDSPHTVGQIITASAKSKRFPLFGENNEENWEAWIDKKEGGAIIVSIPGILKFPHLFRPMPWWEGRKPEDMPEYVKCIKTPDQIHFPDEVYKPEWVLDGIGCAGKGYIILNTDCFIPATEQEYNDYQKQKAGKKRCPHCGGSNVIVFDADNDLCRDCDKWFPAV